MVRISRSSSCSPALLPHSVPPFRLQACGVSSTGVKLVQNIGNCCLLLFFFFCSCSAFFPKVCFTHCSVTLTDTLTVPSQPHTHTHHTCCRCGNSLLSEGDTKFTICNTCETKGRSGGTTTPCCVMFLLPVSPVYIWINTALYSYSEVCLNTSERKMENVKQLH